MEADEELRCNRIGAKLLQQEKEHLWCRQTKDISALLYVFETENDCFRRLRKRSTTEMRTCVAWWATLLLFFCSPGVGGLNNRLLTWNIDSIDEYHKAKEKNKKRFIKHKLYTQDSINLHFQKLLGQDIDRMASDFREINPSDEYADLKRLGKPIFIEN